MVSIYLNWLKESPIWAIIVVFVIVSLLCSRIVTFGICYYITKDKKSLSKKIFWFTFVSFFIVQLISFIFYRV